MSEKTTFLDLDRAECQSLIDAARDASPVSGLTHNHYKYPARFSPKFVRAAIEAFTNPGDTVLDPFVGGGTTLVESLSLGRNAIGIDISSLAVFVSNAKTLLLENSELAAVERWANGIVRSINMHRRSARATEYIELGYYRNINGPAYWPLRKAIEQALESAGRLRAGRSELLARCIILRAAQWALDSRKRLPSVSEFREALAENAKVMTSETRAFSSLVRARPVLPSVTTLHANVATVTSNNLPTKTGRARLVLTSPPYPGVHVLYHRWQVDGRKETPAPFWIANKLDGAGSSYYTFGDRKNPGLTSYFANLLACVRSTVELADPSSVFVQVVAFSDPAWQMQKYLETMKQAGLSELYLPFADGPDGRLWRAVPNRRWHAQQRGPTSGSNEAVLFHRINPSVRHAGLPEVVRRSTPMRAEVHGRACG